MNKLDKNKVYDLSELTIDELQNVWNYLRQNNKSWEDYPFTEMVIYQKTHMLVFGNYGWHWNDIIKLTTNAKELFYTLENVQVDCSELTEGQVKEMCKVYESNGYKQWIDEDALKIENGFTYLRTDWANEFYINGESGTKTTITYEKFMEMFAPKYEDTMKVDQPKGELCDNLKPLINAVEILNKLKAYKEKSEEILTLDSIQVDCRNLTEEQINDMADVFEKNGFNLSLDGTTDEHFYLRLAKCGDSVDLFRLDDTKTTITYEKFMELFGENDKLPPYKEVPLKWNYETLVGDNQVVDEHIKEFIPSKKQVLKYLLERDIILTPKQYKKLWKKS